MASNTFSIILAMANIVEGDISDLLAFKDAHSSALVIFKSSCTSQNLSVFAVHNTIT